MSTKQNQKGIGQIPQPPAIGSSGLARWERQELSFIKLYMEICGASEAQARIVYGLHCHENNERNRHWSDQNPNVVSPT